MLKITLDGLRAAVMEKKAEADEEGLALLEQALGRGGTYDGEELMIGDVHPKVFSVLQDRTPEYKNNRVVVPPVSVQHLYDRRIQEGKQSPAAVTGVLRALLNDPDLRVCESIHDVHRHDDPCEILINRKDDKRLNLAAVIPQYVTGSIRLNSAYAPKEKDLCRLLFPSRSTDRIMREWSLAEQKTGK